MTPQLTWTREADTLVLAGELDQDVLTPLWDARRSDDWRYPYRPEPDLQGGYRGTGAAGAPCEPGKKQGNAVSLSGVNDKVYALAQLYNLPEDVLPRM